MSSAIGSRGVTGVCGSTSENSAKSSFEFQILRRSFWAQPLVALVQVLLPQRVDVDVVGRLGRSAVSRTASLVSASPS